MNPSWLIYNLSNVSNTHIALYAMLDVLLLLQKNRMQCHGMIFTRHIDPAQEATCIAMDSLPRSHHRCCPVVVLIICGTQRSHNQHPR